MCCIQVAREKDVQAIAQKGKEMSGTKSFDSFELLGRVVGFPDVVCTDCLVICFTHAVLSDGSSDGPAM